MASSDEEGEIVPQFVTDYHFETFVNEQKEPVSLSALPHQWSDDEVQGDCETQVFLFGRESDGLLSLHKRVIAWKFEISNVQPHIAVLTKNKSWIKLLDPRKCFQNIIRTTLVTVHWLHFVKMNPEASGELIWNHLLKVFSSYEVQPSESDLLDHMQLIRKTAERDNDLAKSKYLISFVEPRKNKPVGEDVQTPRTPDFINDNGEDEDDNDIDNEEDEEESNFFDTVCTICDNGGEVLCCQGSCMRSFHGSIDTGADSACETLGYTRTEVEAMPSFLCRNCQYNQHQCFACGVLGSSDMSSDPEVFPCIAGGCGRFYHPDCVAKLLQPANETLAKLSDKIAAGEAFTCPSHKCFFCKEFENKKDRDLQLAMCRRCPKSYHRKCLPKAIGFEYTGEFFQRAWDGLLPNNRILMYCLKHKIVGELGTPERNHLAFPEAERKKRKYSSVLKLSKEKVAPKTNMVSEDLDIERPVVTTSKPSGKAGSGIEVCESTKKEENRFYRQDFNPKRKQKILDIPRKSFKDKSKFIPEKVPRYIPTDEGKLSMRKSNSTLNNGSIPVKSKQPNMDSSKLKNTISMKPMLGKTTSSQPFVDVKMEKGILALMKDSTASFDIEEFKKRHGVPSNQTGIQNLLDKTLTVGKVEMSVKAIRAALQKLEEGGSIDDAKAICEPDLLNQMFRWKGRLSVYLSPFLYGKCYTSFGRHFTKLDKLKEIVNRLHWYVKDGDMIVDFCCGSNDFSCLMKEKLDKMGKHCFFKNYDLIQTKNDFNFERRDWMTVKPEELGDGSRLIMGLNPPFGVNASLANKFIDKALEFKPKLLILIVPKETHRLDRKVARYDLIWEDDRLLSGKSFYLPGSVDMHDKQVEDWNLKPPPLFLWSRPDWSLDHLAIAQERSHVSPEQANHMKSRLMEENRDRAGGSHKAEQERTRTGIPRNSASGQRRDTGIATHPPPPYPVSNNSFRYFPPRPSQNVNDQLGSLPNFQTYGGATNFPIPPTPGSSIKFSLPPPPPISNHITPLLYGGSMTFPPPPPLPENDYPPPPPPPESERSPTPPPPPPPLPEDFPSPTPSTRRLPNVGAWLDE